VAVTALTSAATWLRQYLAEQNGPVQAAVVFAAGKQAGHAERSLRRAATIAGVDVTRRGFGGGTTWALSVPPTPSTPEPDEPPQQHSEGDKPAQRPAGRVPVEFDIYGRATRWVTVDSAASASMWDGRAWNRIAG
jgi:hypothetical protein